MAASTGGWEHNYSKPNPEHSYARAEQEDQDNVDTGEDKGKISVSSIRLYFEGLKVAVEEEEGEHREEEEHSEEEESSPSNNQQEDPGKVIELEELYAVELKTYSTVGGISKPMMVTVLNVAAMSLKCITCKGPFEKQLSAQSLNGITNHLCPLQSAGTQTPIVGTRRRQNVENLKNKTQTKTKQSTDGKTKSKEQRFSDGRTSSQEEAKGQSTNILKGRTKDKENNAGQRISGALSAETLLSTKVRGGPEGAKAVVVKDKNGVTGERKKPEDCPDPAGAVAEKLRYGEQWREKYYCVLCAYNVKHRCTKLWKMDHKCPECDQIFKIKSELDKHMLVHTGEKPYQCETCGKDFRHRHVMIAHSMIHDEGRKKFLCDVCGRKFIRKSDQRRHVREHNGIFPHYCKVCNKGIRHRMVLEMHMRKHTREKPYLCPICGQKLTNDVGYQFHLRQHEINDNPLKCIECKETFQDTDELRLHTCSGGKKRLCTVCGKTFQKHLALRRHMEIHLRINPSSCKSCNRTFQNDMELQMHEDENIVKCSDCGETIKEARSCMLETLQESDRAAKMKKFKCWTCHSDKNMSPESSEMQDADLQIAIE